MSANIENPETWLLDMMWLMVSATALVLILLIREPMF